MAQKKQNPTPKPGPAPTTLTITGNWQAAVKKAVAKKKPAKGWPK
jgi:hypothetical protein